MSRRIPAPAGSPVLSRAVALERLRTVVAKGRALVAARPRAVDDWQLWKAEADQVLVESLGAGHELVSKAATAGAPVLSLYGMSSGELARRYAESIASQIRYMDELCIPYLAKRDEGTAHEGDGYDVAWVCRRGHVINRAARQNPEYNAAFCADCGAEAINACRTCNAPVRGTFWAEGNVLQPEAYRPPGYCSTCGRPFPWTEARMTALSEYLALVGAEAEERAALTNSVAALVAASPETPLAVAKWNRYLAKAGKEVANAVRDVLVDVISEAAKKALFGS